jgi:hypothetical protein
MSSGNWRSFPIPMKGNSYDRKGYDMFLRCQIRCARMQIGVRRSKSTIALAALILLIPVSGAAGDDRDITSRGPSSIEKIDLGLDLPEIEPVYLILCPEEFKEEASVLAIHRTKMGFPSEIFTLDDIESEVEGSDLEEKVHNFLQYTKGERPSIKWLLILGDSEFLMPRQLWHYSYSRGQPFGDYYYSDVYYAGLGSDWDEDGDGRYGEVNYNGTIEGDLNWDLYVGRLPASNETQASNYISKLIRYETDPPVGTWMSRFLNWGSLMEPPNLETTVNRYYPHKSNAYKVCQRVKGNLPSYLDYKELYDYQQLEGGNYSMYDATDTLNRNNMLSQFNSGASMLNFVGQARYQAYALNDYGAPYGDGTLYVWNEPMTYQDHSIFTNGDMMPFMYASTCDTAKFFQTGWWEDKSLETWLTSQSGGVIGLISSTNVSARGEEKNRTWGNWYLDEEFWKLFVNSGETRPGRTMYLLKDRYKDKWFSPTMEIKETIVGMIYAYILLGEPAVDIYTDIAERFPNSIDNDLAIYQGEHGFSFQVKDRYGDPVSEATMTIHSHSTYSVFHSDDNGLIEGIFDPNGDSDLNITLTGHNMVLKSYSLKVKEEIPDLVILPDTLSIEPAVYDHGDTVTMGFRIMNRGGQIAEDVKVRIEATRDGGENWTLIERREMENLGEDIIRDFTFIRKVLAGDIEYRFIVETSSEEIDPSNNEISVPFNIPGPGMSFEMGSGFIRPSSIVRPGSDITMDFDVYNEGPSWGNLVLQAFLGDPEAGGIPVSEKTEIGVVGIHEWANGSLRVDTPSSTGLIYLVMDPDREYETSMKDGPVKSLIEINEAPRRTRNLSMVILEDSGKSRIRLDDAFSDADNSTNDIDYTFQTYENITAGIVREGLETYLEIEVPPNWWGDFTILINASDGLGMITSPVNVSVLPVNDPPVIPNALDGRIELKMVEDLPFSATIAAYDIEGDPLVFEVLGAPFNLDNTTGVIEWTPGQSDVGKREWSLKVSDGRGGESVITLAIEISERNDPPTIQPIDDVSLNENQEVTFDLVTFDEEGADLEFTTSHPFATVRSDDTLVLKWDERWIGLTNVKLDVTDGINTVSITLNVTMLEPEIDDTDRDVIEIEAIIAVLGITLVVIAILGAIFIAMGRNRISRQVEKEKLSADEMYERKMNSLEE